MSTDTERDQSTDRLLRAAVRPDDAPVCDACLDAETLAAWADGALYGEDAVAIEAHLADCVRCQSMMATLAQSEPDATAAGTAPVEKVAPAPLAFRSRRTVHWFLPVAATAAAASLLIWTFVRTRAAIPPPADTLATVQAPPAPIPATAPEAGAPTTPPAPAVRKSPITTPAAKPAAPTASTPLVPARATPAQVSAVPTPVAAELLTRTPTSVRLSGVVTDKDGGLVPGATVVVTSVDTGEKRPPQITNAAGAYSFPGVAPGKYHVTISLPGFKTTEIDATVTAGSSNALSTKLEVGAVSEVVYVQAGTELVRSNPPTVTQSVSTAFSQTLSRSDRNTANYLVLLPGGGVEFGPPPAPTATPQAATAAQAGGAGAGTARVVGGAQRGAQESSTPQRGVVRWRVDAAGQVSKSVDAGRTWTRIALDRVSNIVSGAAPSDSVCWLIGRAGLVLLSVDGSTFKPVAAPASADLRTITAVDARQATVTTVAGVVYATSDGGVTWKRPDGLQ